MYLTSSFVNHTRRSSVNFGEQDISARKHMCEKLTKCLNFTRHLPEKKDISPNFGGKCSNFYTIFARKKYFVGGQLLPLEPSSVFYAYVVNRKITRSKMTDLVWWTHNRKMRMMMTNMRRTNPRTISRIIHHARPNPSSSSFVLLLDEPFEPPAPALLDVVWYTQPHYTSYSIQLR